MGKRNDNSLVKRIELHCHTKMSDMDGVSNVADIIKRAKKWGMPALAVTDHGCVQAFTEASHSLDKNDPFKVIYGVEGYLVDDTKQLVENSRNQSFDDPYVVFDIETTGFSPEKNRIIEIGAVKDGLSDAASDFIKFIMSEDGQKVVEDNGYISQGNEGAYTASGLKGKVVVAGSSSVTPVMEKLKEAYVAVNPDVEIEVQQSDSTTGMTSAIEGVCDIGMASRDLKDSELEAGLTPTVIAMDGIAVVVNNESPVPELTSENVKDIFTGDITDWADVQ